MAVSLFLLQCTMATIDRKISYKTSQPFTESAPIKDLFDVRNAAKYHVVIDPVPLFEVLPFSKLQDGDVDKPFVPMQIPPDQPMFEVIDLAMAKAIQKYPEKRIQIDMRFTVNGEGLLNIQSMETSPATNQDGEIARYLTSTSAVSERKDEIDTRVFKDAFWAIVEGTDGSRYKVHYDIESDYSHLKGFKLNKVYTLESSDLVQNTRSVVPEEHHVISIESIQDLRTLSDQERFALEFDVKGKKARWEVNECQMWYVKRFVEGLSEFVIPDQCVATPTCLGGTRRSDVNCAEFCKDFHLRMT